MATIDVDGELGNADWTKGSWDILDVETEEELKLFLEQRGTTLAQFKKLPAYQGWLDRNGRGK